MAQVTGKIGNQKWVAKVPLDQGAEQIGIAKLWAREKISNLERNRVSLNPNENQKLIWTQSYFKQH